MKGPERPDERRLQQIAQAPSPLPLIDPPRSNAPYRQPIYRPGACPAPPAVTEELRHLQDKLRELQVKHLPDPNWMPRAKPTRLSSR